MSVNVIAAAVGSDIEGRECFLPARGVVGVVESVGAGGALRVVVDGRLQAGAGVVVLPRLGESVWLARGAGEPVVGLWVGLRVPLPAAGQAAAGQPAGEQGADQPVTARLLVDGAVVEHTAQPSAFDARAAVLTVEASDAPAALEAPVAPAGALRALAQLAGALDAQAAEHAAQVAEHAGWKDRFAAAAADKADELDLCGQFDDFMHHWGLPGRTRTYAVRVSTTEDLTVYVQAAGEDEAEAQVTGELVDQARSAAGMHWQIEYTEHD